MEKTERFGLVLSPAEKHILQLLAELERIPKAAIIRRLIWREAELSGAIRSPNTKKSLNHGGGND